MHLRQIVKNTCPRVGNESKTLNMVNISRRKHAKLKFVGKSIPDGFMRLWNKDTTSTKTNDPNVVCVPRNKLNSMATTGSNNILGVRVMHDTTQHHPLRPTWSDVPLKNPTIPAGRERLPLDGSRHLVTIWHTSRPTVRTHFYWQERSVLVDSAASLCNASFLFLLPQ